MNILTVTLNPALDLATSVPVVMPEVKLRCGPVSTDPGGGGINVSRVILVLGGRSRCLVALGGDTGNSLSRRLAAAGLDVATLPAPGETRQSLAVTDDATGLQYRFVMPGPQWRTRDEESLLLAICRQIDGRTFVVLSGSNPPGVSDAFAVTLARQLPAPARLVVDTSGPALHALITAAPGIDILRMDRLEAEDISGAPLKSRTDSADFAASLVAAGVAQMVLVARGSDGNILACPKGRWHVEAAPVPVLSKVGAGDSFLAGFVHGIQRGDTPDRALGLAAACASATCMTPATELCHPEDIARLDAARIVTPL